MSKKQAAHTGSLLWGLQIYTNTRTAFPTSLEQACLLISQIDHQCMQAEHTPPCAAWLLGPVIFIIITEEDQSNPTS